MRPLLVLGEGALLSWRFREGLLLAFVNLHTHSSYYLLDGMCRIDELVARAKELGQPAIAITEHGNLHSLIKMKRECDKQGIKLIPGIEAYIVPDRLQKSK